MLSSASITRCSNPSFKFLEQRFGSAAVSDRALSCAIRSQRQQRSGDTLVGTLMGVRAASRGAWTAATIAMPDGLTDAVTDGLLPSYDHGAYGGWHYC